MGVDWFKDVLEFHRKFCPDLIGTVPCEPDPTAVHVRKELIREEIAELFDAMVHGDVPGVADGIADAVYVLIGAAITYGIDLRPVWSAVHKANLAKDGGGRREDRKVMKPPGWVAPDIAGILENQWPLERGDVS